MNNKGRSLAVFILLGLLAAALPGQGMSARILGNVMDENGVYLHGVTITATNIGNNAVAETTTGKKKGRSVSRRWLRAFTKSVPTSKDINPIR